MRDRRVTAPGLSKGSLPLPHLGDWTQEGQPASQVAGHDRLAGGAEPVLGGGVAAFGEAGATGVTVIDKNRRQAGVRVGGGRDARRCPSGRSWRPAAAARSRHVRRRAGCRGSPARSRRRRSGPLDRPCSRQRPYAAAGPAGQVASGPEPRRRAAGVEVRHDLAGHVHDREAERDSGPVFALQQRLDHRHVSDVAGVGGPVRVLGVYERGRSSRSSSSTR